MSTTLPASGALMGVPVGAAMSMPLCGRRDSPLNTRRKPKELERGPGTGCARRNVAGASGEKLASAARTFSLSLAMRSSFSGEGFTIAGATLSCCVRYCLGRTWKEILRASRPGCSTSTLRSPGSTSSGMPTMASHPSPWRTTIAARSACFTTGFSSALPGMLNVTTPPGTAETRGATNPAAYAAGAASNSHADK